jgi:hypothetical protein
LHSSLTSCLLRRLGKLGGISVIFDGRNGGTVELLDNVLVIRRKGVASFLTQGLKGEKRIPYASINSVQFKEAGFTTGYIQFGISGGIESRRGVWDATTDENTVLFTKEAAEKFRELRDIVEDRAAAARQGQSAAKSPSPSANVADELTRLADLRDRGVLTDEEFAEQKSRLLGSGAASQGAGPSMGQATPPRSAVSDLRSKSQDSADSITEPPKGGVGKVVGIGCLVVLGIFILLAAIGSQVDQSNATGSATANLTAADLNAAETNVAANPEAENSSWSYSEDEDKVRGGTTYYARTTSTNSISQSFPYDSDTTMAMTVRKSPAYGTDVVLTISSGQMMCPSYEGCSGTVRFDSGPAQRVSFSGPEDNSSDTIFVDGAKGFIAKLKSSKTVTIEKTLYEAGSPQFEFDVRGLKWSH